MVWFIRIVAVLAAGMLVVSCGPQVHDMNGMCSFSLHDGPTGAAACLSSTSFCGDGWCNGLEGHLDCPGDCAPPVCGDGVCSAGEDIRCPDCAALLVCCCCDDGGQIACDRIHVATCGCAASPASTCD